MTTTRLPKTITAGALLATPIPPVKWIIPGLLPAGLAIFAGPSKAGKSWLTLWLCLQISQGKSVWGREIEPRTVLYFSLEDTLGRLQERLYKLVDAEEDPERLILQTESHGIGQGLEEQIVSFIHTYPDISLIVIDTLQKVRKSDQNGSMYANDYKDIGALKELADKYGICILLVHHLRKQSSSDPYDQISGSTGIMGVADTTWLMHRQRMSKTATIRVIGRDMDEKMLHIREENCVWTLDEEETAEQQALKTIPDYLWKVADYIDSVGKWQGTATELLVAANISDVKPNQFTRKMAHYARDVFSPRGIEYKYTRTEQKRLFEFFHDDDDGDDDDIDISELFHWGIPQTSSSSSASSLRSLEGSKHTPKRYRPKDGCAGKGVLQIFFEVFFGKSQMHRLYLYYCYQLGILPKKQQPRINRPELERIWKDTEKILAEHAFVRDHKFPSLQAIIDYRMVLSRQIEILAAQRAEVVKQMRRKDAPPELADRRAMLTCKIAELRKEDKIAEGAIKRIQRTRESNHINQENQYTNNKNRRRNRSRQR